MIEASEISQPYSAGMYHHISSKWEKQEFDMAFGPKWVPFTRVTVVTCGTLETASE